MISSFAYFASPVSGMPFAHGRGRPHAVQVEKGIELRAEGRRPGPPQTSGFITLSALRKPGGVGELLAIELRVAQITTRQFWVAAVAQRQSSTAKST